MRNLMLFLFASVFIVNICQASSNRLTTLFWEDLSEKEQESILTSSSIDKDAVLFYQNRFKISDNQPTINLLNKITSDKNLPNEETVFYFYVFNQICLQADGALSEMLGSYCIKEVLQNPQFVLLYFQQNWKLEKKYAELIGPEFYFKGKNTSDVEYNYSDFKKIICDKTKKDKLFEKILVKFYQDIESAMKNMD